MSQVARLCLGTASFGMAYPPGSRSPRPTHMEAGEILDYAWHHGVVNVDTAAAYGDAEDLCEQYLMMNVRVTTKSAPEFYYTKMALETRQRHHGIHDWTVLLHNPTLKQLQVAADGASVYTPAEALFAIAAGLKIIQIPYHILNQSHARAGVFEAAKAAGVTVYARQPFARGEALKQFSVETCLRFALESPAQFIVFGVSTLAQLEDVISIAASDPPPTWRSSYANLLSIFADSALELASVCTVR